MLARRGNDSDGGSGESLPKTVLLLATISAGVSTVVSIWTIGLQLKNYRKPLLQRWVVRILLMVPIYSLASLIALYSLEAAFLIDLVRDLYEAFCIYCFFCLLITYLGGERSLLILLHGREPTPHPWPVNRFVKPLDISDPFSFLNLKRGILQYVQIKPVLAIVTILLKAAGAYGEGHFEGNAGYTYVSVIYNFSVTLSLYCLAMFWVCTSHDLKPYRPMPKFLCVKALIFFTFWQGLAISILVRAGIVKPGGYTTEHFSIAVQDALLCFEMPLFAVLHLYAFSHKDYLPTKTQTYSGRLPFWFAFRDSLLGYKDVLDDSLTTLRGTGFSYRTFEPAEGGLHSVTGDARAKRARAGLRYADGGRKKYWLPMPGADVEEAYGRRPTRAAPLGYRGTDATDRLIEVAEHPFESTSSSGVADFLAHPIQTIGRKVREKRDERRGYAPIAPEQAEEVVHQDSRYAGTESTALLAEHLNAAAGVVPFAGIHGMHRSELTRNSSDDDSLNSTSNLEFGDPEEEEERLYSDARQLEFGDYNYPILDASKEEARARMRELEDDFIRGRRTEWRMTKEADQRAWRADHGRHGRSKKPDNGRLVGKGKTRARNEDLPEGCIDILVEDHEAEEEAEALERDRGEPALRTEERKRIFRRTYGTIPAEHTGVETVHFPRATPSLPASPPPETTNERLKQEHELPAETVARPRFAVLTHLDDGRAFTDIDDSAVAAGSRGDQQSQGPDRPKSQIEDSSSSHQQWQRSQGTSQSTHFNPWL